MDGLARVAGRDSRASRSGRDLNLLLYLYVVPQASSLEKESASRGGKRVPRRLGSDEAVVPAGIRHAKQRVI